MTTTTRQDTDFMESVMSLSLLEDSIEWIATNLSPEDVFSTEHLEDCGLREKDSLGIQATNTWENENERA